MGEAREKEARKIEGEGVGREEAVKPILDSTATAGGLTPPPPSSPIPYDSILESKDSIITGAILLRLDPSCLLL
ncbi:hypothetical protein AYX13_06987 [Cryptococcus neoformans]|nr:hypothetical protein AYX13_06987 [Cryptococcus neoformans var. grubii]